MLDAVYQACSALAARAGLNPAQRAARARRSWCEAGVRSAECLRAHGLPNVHGPDAPRRRYTPGHGFGLTAARYRPAASWTRPTRRPRTPAARCWTPRSARRRWRAWAMTADRAGRPRSRRRRRAAAVAAPIVVAGVAAGIVLSGPPWRPAHPAAAAAVTLAPPRWSAPT